MRLGGKARAQLNAEEMIPRERFRADTGKHPN